MNLTSGTRLGPYEIVSALGAGGMGEVYRARDTRLDRSVAVKILPAEFANNAQLRIRFEREAKTISQMNHPNICTLYDVGHDGDALSYIVMELVEGETLADRLQRGPLPVHEVLRFGANIADALARAHAAGIVHRDLKPGNIMLTRGGAKLLDFGLAKPAELFGSSAPNDKTLQQQLTAEGAIVGTFHYMAPEQLDGAAIDARTDIFSFGAVLYEMVTGRKAFDGATRTSIIAAIVSAMPRPVTELQPVTPLSLERVILKALAKDPAERWQSAHDMADELRWIAGSGSTSTIATMSPLRQRKPTQWIVLAALMAIVATVMGAMWLRARSTSQQRHLVADFAPPPKTTFNNVGDNCGPPVISPDGRYVVFSAGSGTNQLWIRTIATGETRALSGTENGWFPFWSPDSRNIGFFTGNQLMRLDIAGGAPIALANCVAARGGSWSREGVIVYAASVLSPLMKVSDHGGTSVAVTKLELPRQTTHRWPSFLPDGKHFIYLAANHQDETGGSNGVYLGSIDGAAPKLVMNTTGNAIYSKGKLLFVRDTQLYAQTMSEDGIVSGEPSIVAQNVLNDTGIWRGGFSVSENGDLVYAEGQASVSSRLLWVDRSGKEIGTIGEPDRYWDVQLSPDGTKLLLSKGNPSREVWLGDLNSNTQTRIDFGSNVRWSGFPAWSPDGKLIVGSAITNSGAMLIVKPLDGPASLFAANPENPMAIDTALRGLTVSHDDKTLVYASRMSLWSMPITGGARKQLTPASFESHWPRYSPDDALIAFVSSANGRDDVFIGAADDLNQRIQLSDHGGDDPLWRADGKELYYIDGSDQLTAVEITRNGRMPVAGRATRLFPLRGAYLGHVYTATPDGQKFLINRIPETYGVGVKFVTNWKAVLAR